MEPQNKNKNPGYPLALPQWIRYMLSPFFLVHKKGKSIYLTFDDGPIPEITPAVLDILKQYEIQGTFFCVGENIQKHPDTFKRLISEGHTVGSHTLHHLNGFKTKNNLYIKDTIAAANLVPTNLFRPPYGRINLCQYLHLRPKYRIVLWSILTGDYIADFTYKDCVDVVLKNVKGGDIIVFHDSLKAAPRMLKALPIIIEKLIERGYTFKTL